MSGMRKAYCSGKWPVTDGMNVWRMKSVAVEPQTTSVVRSVFIRSILSKTYFGEVDCGSIKFLVIY